MTTAEARCDVTELLVSQCAHCRKTPTPKSTPATYGPRFDARWSGFCSCCGDEFASGEQIRADGCGGYLAECCGGDDA
jgi:hypothetical protein